jgi:hypothetical protein
MNVLNTFLILIGAYLSVFLESAFGGLRSLLGAQIDLLPALMVYASLSADLLTVVLLATLGGLWFDSLSANPLGVSILPLFLPGLVIYVTRDLILREQVYAQSVLGLALSATTPLLTLLLLLTGGRLPLLGWGTLWQWIVLSVGGAVAAPLWFKLFGRLERGLVHNRDVQSSFRSDREIRRGRS